MDGEQVEEVADPIEARYDAEADAVEARGVRMPAELFRGQKAALANRFFAFKPVGSGLVDLVEVQPRMAITLEEKPPAGRIAVPNAPSSKIMLPGHVAQRIASERKVGVQEVK